MEKLPMCRVCLAEDVRMYVVVNKNLREVYEKLTDIPFITEDSRPMLACFFCCAKLKQCYQFQRKCLEAEELFTQIMNEDYELNPLLNRGRPEFCNGFIQSPMEHVSIDGECQTGSDAIKEELPAVCERQDYIIEPKEEYQSNELQLENQENSFSDEEDVPAQHSESDSEGGDLLRVFKIKVEKEQEISNKKPRAGDSQRAPAAKRPKLHPRRSTVEDVITEEQTEHKQSDTTVIQNPPNCALTTVTEFKDPLPYAAPRVTNSGLDTGSQNDSDNEDGKGLIYNKGIDYDDINRHSRLRVQETPYKCDTCQRSFRVKSSLADHIRINCDVSQHFLSDKSSLKEHIRTHTGEKPYKCEYCQHGFTKKNNLTIHILTHFREKPYKCEYCQHSFTKKTYLTNHIRTHTGEKPYKCEHCQHCYTVKSSLKIHTRTHTGEKPYKCEFCQQGFTNNSNLRRHIRQHKGEKPYECELCQRCFSNKNSLTYHIRKHTGEKPYKCQLCQHCFISRNSLKLHTRTHTGEKPFKCDVCKRGFTDKSNLIRHIRLQKCGKPFK